MGWQKRLENTLAWFDWRRQSHLHNAGRSQILWCTSIPPHLSTWFQFISTVVWYDVLLFLENAPRLEKGHANLHSQSSCRNYPRALTFWLNLVPSLSDAHPWFVHINNQNAFPTCLDTRTDTSINTARCFLTTFCMPPTYRRMHSTLHRLFPNRAQSWHVGLPGCGVGNPFHLCSLQLERGLTDGLFSSLAPSGLQRTCACGPIQLQGQADRAANVDFAYPAEALKGIGTSLGLPLKKMMLIGLQRRCMAPFRSAPSSSTWASARAWVLFSTQQLSPSVPTHLVRPPHG